MINPNDIDWDDMTQRADLIGRKPCCKDDFGGSHYHCGRCGQSSSMQGHFQGVHWIDGKREKVLNHFCCPGNCELDQDY